MIVQSELQNYNYVAGVNLQVVTAKIPKQICGHSSEFTKRKTNPTKRYIVVKLETTETNIFLIAKKANVKM